MQKTIIMTDIDGVLLNSHYRATHNIGYIFKKIEEAGAIIVPSSDTPLERIKSIFKKEVYFKPDCAIAEKGAVILMDSKKIYPFSINLQKDECSLGALLPPEIKIIHSPAIEAFHEKSFDSKNNLRPGDRFVIIDSLREQGISLFFLKISNKIPEKIERDPEGLLAHQLFVKEKLKLICPDIEVVDLSEKYSLMIAAPKQASKTYGYKFLKNIYPESKFYMIGDGSIDIIDDPEVVHCAVANGHKDLKNHADFISELETTEGLAECLEWILKNK